MATTYTEAKELLSASGLRPKTEAEFRQLAKDGALPPGLPKYPYEKYKNNGWISWGDFLESGYVANANRSYVSYEEAKRIIANANPRPRTRSEYNEAIRSGALPSNLPLNAPLIYKNDGWQGVGDYLGTGRVATQHQKFLSYAECKEAIRAMELPPTSQKEWQLMARQDLLPPGIPHNERPLMYLTGNYCYRINAIAPRPIKTVHESYFGRLRGQNDFKSVDL